MKFTIFHGSCEDMSKVESESISCIFTSPPYALAKDYGDTTGIGMTESVDAYREYLDRMTKVLHECFRVMKPGRHIGVNIADVIQTDNYGSEKKPIRFHYFNIMRKAGFEYLDVICWKKPEGMGTQKRFGVFIQHPYPTYYRPNNIYEPILLFKKPGHFEMSKEQKEDNKLNWEDFKKYQTDIWEVQPDSNTKHPAPFPWKLPHVFFQLYSLKGETVMDPFMGSGSSMLAARKLKRNCIGFEINPEYIEIIKARVGFAQSGQGTMEMFGMVNDDLFEVIQ